MWLRCRRPIYAARRARADHFRFSRRAGRRARGRTRPGRARCDRQPGRRQVDAGRGVAAASCRRSRSAHVPMDGFHLADVALRRLGRLQAKGAPDTFDAGGYVGAAAPAAGRHRGRDLRAGLRARPGTAAGRGDRGAAGGPAGAHRGQLPAGRRRPLGRRCARELAEVWFCDPDPKVRMAQLIARHVQFGKDPEHASGLGRRRSTRATPTLVEATRSRADLIVPADVLAALPAGRLRRDARRGARPARRGRSRTPGRARPRARGWPSRWVLSYSMSSRGPCSR